MYDNCNVEVQPAYCLGLPLDLDNKLVGPLHYIIAEKEFSYQSGCVCLALIVLVGPISSLQYVIAWSLEITIDIIGPELI